MTKEEFFNFSISEQVNFVNVYLQKGKSLIDIFKRERIIEADESSVRKRFVKNGYKYDKDKKQYVLSITQVPQNDYVKEDYNNNTKVIHRQTENKPSNSMVIPSEQSEVLLKLIEHQPKLEEMLEWWQKEKNIIEVPQIDIKNEELQGEIIPKTFKIYKQVIDQFLNFCEKHKEYTQRDLVSMALLEYSKKYK